MNSTDVHFVKKCEAMGTILVYVFKYNLKYAETKCDVWQIFSGNRKGSSFFKYMMISSSNVYISKVISPLSMKNIT